MAQRVEMRRAVYRPSLVLQRLCHRCLQFVVSHVQTVPSSASRPRGSPADKRGDQIVREEETSWRDDDVTMPLVITRLKRQATA